MADIGSDSDSSLIAAAAAGDRDAFAALLERHYDRIHGLAWQLTGSRADADDIAQDVCCTLVEKLASFRGADLSYADFSHAGVEEADLSHAKLFRARFHQTRDEGAVFTSRAGILGDDEELLEAERWSPREAS